MVRHCAPRDGVRMEGYNKGGFGCWFGEKEGCCAFVFTPWVNINHWDGQRITGNQGVSGRESYLSNCLHIHYYNLHVARFPEG